MHELKWISVTVLVTFLLAAQIAVAETSYRWKDENGETHYGRTIPPQYADKPYEILNASGMVIEVVDDPIARNKKPVKTVEEKKIKPLYSDHEVRLRSDRLLVLRYPSEKGIIDAMEVEVAQLGYDARLILQGQTSVLQSLGGQVKNAADRQRAAMPADPELELKINRLRQRLLDSERSLAALREREEKIRADFSVNLERYRYLQNGGTPGSMPVNTEAETDAEAETEAEPESTG